MKALVACLPLLTALPCAAADDADLLASINQIRERGCEGRAGKLSALRRDPRLDRAAEAIANGRRLKDAVKDAHYPGTQAALLESSGSDAAIERALAEEGCKDIADPVYREVGIAAQPGKAWIVLAAPLVPPSARDRGSVAARVLALVNEARGRSRRCGWKRYDTAPPLARSAVLDGIALAHAKDMAARGVMSHTGADGSSAADRATRAGYRWRFIGENVAAGQPTPEQAVAEWLKSARHCANIMSADFSEMGVAYAASPKTAGGVYWAQVFGTPLP